MLRLDLVAGLTVSLISLPLAMAFAAAAGLGPDIGLVSAIVAGGVAALFGGSELNITGPAGSLIGVLAGVLIANEIGGYQDVLALGKAFQNEGKRGSRSHLPLLVFQDCTQTWIR